MFILFTLLTVTFAKSDINCASAYCSACDTTQCTNCINDFILVNGECKFCRDAMENCRYAKNGKCSECFSGYYLNAEKTECLKEDPNCDEYKNGKCVECEDGYKLTNGECEKCAIIGCEECSRDINVCTECMDGYYLENGQCTQPIANCEEYEKRGDQLICEECLRGYRLEKNQCIKIEQDNCMIYANGTCTQCFGPYTPVNGKCESTEGAVQTIEHCIEYDEDGEFECEECEEGYYTNENEDKCLKCDPSCKTCDDSATECETCAEGYYVNERDRCVKCEKQFAECSNYRTEETCYQCNHKCNWNNNQCVESHCAIYESGEDDPKCMKCEKGYVLSSNSQICTPTIDGCKEKIGEKCVECEKGYFITEDFKCEECSENCKTCVYKADNCQSCTKESGVSEYNCLSCDVPNCEICSSLTTKCAVCQLNYTLTSMGACEKDCYMKDGNNKCTLCNDDVNHMDVLYPPTEEGICLKYSQMPNTPGALSAGYSLMVLFVAVLLLMI